MELCPGKGRVCLEVSERSRRRLDAEPNRYELHGIKRKRIRCELCGRSLIPSAHIGHDGYFIIFELPAHKPKGWWKVKKAVKRNRKENRATVRKRR